MPERKLMIYPKNASRPIMLTDTNCEKSIQELKDNLKTIMNSDSVFAITTKNDMLLGRPSEVGFIQVRSDEDFEDFVISPPEEPEEVPTESFEALDDVDYNSPEVAKFLEEYKEPQDEPTPPPIDDNPYEEDLVITDD
jgi:hypothetical protein